ncbi:MAG: class I SAM-dependent methyltransferase [Dehalococcoidia bacterium]
MDTSLYELFYTLEDKHWWFQGRKDLVLTLLRRYQPQPRPRILDVGCGTGGMLTHFASFGPSLGLDTAPEAAYYCRLRGLQMTLGSGAALPLADGCFDVVSALDVIEHIDDDAAVLAELQRVCAPGGLLLVTVPAFPFLWSSHDVLNHHKRRYVRPELSARIRGAGFELLKLSYYNSLLMPAAIARKYLLRARNNGTASHCESLPMPLNAAFRRVLLLERPILARATLPIGASIICAAQKRK